MAAAGDDGEYLQRHDQEGLLGIPAAFFPYAFALEERPEGDQVEAAVAEELGYGGGPGALDMMHLDEVAYWLLDLHVLDPVFDDPHGDDEDATASVSTITAEISIAGDHERMLLPAEIADWDNIDQYWLLQVHHDLAADPHGDDDESTATSTAAAESWADGGGWEMQIDKGDDEEEWVLRGHDAADDAATASTAESWVGGDHHRLQPYARCDCAAAAAAAGDHSVEYWWAPEPSTGSPDPDQLALEGDVLPGSS